MLPGIQVDVFASQGRRTPDWYYGAERLSFRPTPTHHLLTSSFMEQQSLSPTSESHVLKQWEAVLSCVGALSPSDRRLALGLIQFPDDLAFLAGPEEPFLDVPAPQLPASLDLLLSLAKHELGDEWVPVVGAGLLSGLFATRPRAHLLQEGVYGTCLQVLDRHGVLACLAGNSGMLNLLFGSSAQPEAMLFRDHQLDEVMAQAAMWRICPILVPEVHVLTPAPTNPQADYLSHLSLVLGRDWEDAPRGHPLLATGGKDVVDFLECISHAEGMTPTRATHFATALAWLVEEDLPLPRLSRGCVSALASALEENDDELTLLGLTAARRQALEMSLTKANQREPSVLPLSRPRM